MYKKKPQKMQLQLGHPPLSFLRCQFVTQIESESHNADRQIVADHTGQNVLAFDHFSLYLIKL
jgi:hypothetical protein